jgi:hypothetical protein
MGTLAESLWVRIAVAPRERAYSAASTLMARRRRMVAGLLGTAGAHDRTPVSSPSHRSSNWPAVASKIVRLRDRHELHRSASPLRRQRRSLPQFRKGVLEERQQPFTVPAGAWVLPGVTSERHLALQRPEAANGQA